MFLAPALYLIYALLYAIFTVVTVVLGFRAGFSFSAGLTDLVFSASLPAAANTWMIIPLGIAAFIIFYVVFRFAIVKFDLKTPGREDDDDTEAEKRVVLANDNFQRLLPSSLKVLAAKRTLHPSITASQDFVLRSRITQRLTRRRSNLQVLQA